jgi:hypothetical protein
MTVQNNTLEAFLEQLTLELRCGTDFHGILDQYVTMTCAFYGI